MDSARWKRVEEIYQAAAERKQDERAAFLAVACAEDEELRREGQSLLGAPPAAGERIAHYEIQAKLGEGGMGAVYRAYDTKLRRPVALKILPPEYSSDPERRGGGPRGARPRFPPD